MYGVAGAGCFSVNAIHVTIATSMSYGGPGIILASSFKAGSKVAPLPALFLFGAFPRSITGRSENRTTGRAVWSVTASNSTQETPGQPARFFFLA